jgi:hypothetical protein
LNIVWLSHDELAEMIGELRDVFVARAGNQPASERRPHLMSAIFFPTEEPPQQQADHPQ